MRALLPVRLLVLFSVLVAATPHLWAAADPIARARGADFVGGHSSLVFFEENETGESVKEVQDADEPELQDLGKRLKEMEAVWSKHQDELKEARQSAASKPTIEINGRIHADYWSFPQTSAGIGFFENSDPTQANYGTDPEDVFLFRRVRLEMQGDILENMLWRMQVDFNNPQTPEIKDVYIGFDELPHNQWLQVGNQKRPLGLDALNSSRFNVFLERPFVVDAFNEDARRPGITMYGNSDDRSLGWAYGGYLLENITTDGSYRGDDYQGSLNARLFGSPWYDECSDGRCYWHWGIAGMLAFPDGDVTNQASNQNEGRFRARPEARSMNRWLDTGQIAGAATFQTVGLESIFNVGPLQITGEYLANWTQRDGVGGSDLFFHGGYIYASYSLTGEHIPYDRKDGVLDRLQPFENFFLADRCCGRSGRGWGAWQLGLRYSYLDLTDNDITGGIGHSGTLALNWFFNPYAKLQFNLIAGKIDDRGPIGGFDNGNYLIVGTRLAIEF